MIMMIPMKAFLALTFTSLTDEFLKPQTKISQLLSVIVKHKPSINCLNKKNNFSRVIFFLKAFFECYAFFCCFIIL